MMDMIQQGGPMTAVILVLSAIIAAVFFHCLFHLHRAQIKAGDFLQGIYNIVGKQGGGERLVEAISICDETPGPVAQMTRAAILVYDQGPARIRQAMEEAGLAEIPRLEKNLGLLLALAQLAPMCGLLGTVLGLMDAFMTIQTNAPLVHSGDLATGMWRALISSAAGLLVAIPAYLGYNLLVSRVESIVLDMERVFSEIVMFLEGLSGGKGS